MVGTLYQLLQQVDPAGTESKQDQCSSTAPEVLKGMKNVGDGQQSKAERRAGNDSVQRVNSRLPKCSDYGSGGGSLQPHGVMSAPATSCALAQKAGSKPMLSVSMPCVMAI